MTNDERERMYTLCGRIVEEKDSVRFLLLVEQLNELLGDKIQRLEISTAPDHQDS